MSISLNNRKNTELRHDNGETCLVHHNSITCRVSQSHVTISLCGWDTLITRGKINKFLDMCEVRGIGVMRNKGETVLVRHGYPDVPLAPQDTITIRLSDMAIIQ